ncbi:aminoglycoside phosphotransferase family protein [Streptomyces sp. GC420]|uniref:aminoglycoside phosphotransferase family protein n=1 Tax=Streptomyces sp. GC420 TaxID=2697568 RepID=UPI0014151E0A|nr:aminoglycoside phosphotransferase family protein [Streptomyces sp. GC420]NBM20573.1 kinase [Streptomyces sp. GC420]
MAGTSPFEPPQRLVRALAETHGESAEGWLAGLGATAGEAVARRGLTAERVQTPGGRSGLVLLVRTADGTPAALKLAPPAARPDLEAAALAHWDGWGAVRLLEDPAGSREDGGLLLERLQPEVSLRSLPDAKALLEAAGTIRRLWVEPPAGHPFESVADRTARQAESLRSAADELARPLVESAVAARDELVADPPERLLLHGSFRQGKVLAGERSPWLAVGPDPVVGERAYDLARLTRDRIEDLVASSSGPGTARRRVSRLADSLDLDRDRLRGWSLFRAVESALRAHRAGHRQDAEILLEFAGWL